MWETFVFPDPIRGSSFTCVVQIVASEGASHGSLVGYSCSVQIENRELPPGKFTVYDAFVLSTDPVVLQITDKTRIVRIPAPCHEGMPGVKECCAGMGGIGIAARFLGAPG